MKFASSIMNSIARLLTLLTAILGLAGMARAQNAWEVTPTDVESNRRGFAGVGVGRPALDSWEADAGTLVFHAEPSGTTVTFSCSSKSGGTYRNDVTILVYSDEACTQQVTSGFVRSGNTVVTANPISQAGTFYCILASPDGGGTTYFRHTFGINVKAAPVVPVKTGLQLTPPTTAQLPGGSFTILVKAVDANGSSTTIDGSNSAVTWTFDSNSFTRSGARFTVKSTAATSSQTISANYTTLGGSCTVQVVKPTIASLSLTGVPIVAQTVGKTFTPILTATMSAGPKVKIPASTPGLVWNVNPSILSVSNGVVTVLSGTVDSTPISVLAVEVESNVVNVPIKKLAPTLTGITATPSSTTLESGGSFTPGLALTYSDNTSKTISPTQTGLTWKFDATNFVRNSSTGAFTLKTGGKATSGTLTATYSGKSVEIAVTIARAPFVTGIALDPIPPQPRGTATAPRTFTVVVKKLFSDGSSAVISDVQLTCDSTVFVVKTQGQIQVKPTSTATSGTVTARFGTFSDTKTVSITANAPVPKAVNLIVPTSPLQPGASFTPTVDITWADGTKTTSNLATAGIPYSYDNYSLSPPGTAGVMTVLTTTKSTLGKITLTPPTLQPKTAYVRITQSVAPQKSFITSHVNGAIFGASSATFTATVVKADRVTLRVILNDDTFIDSKDFKPGQIPSITVTDLPLIRSKIKVQATSYYNGNMGSDLLGIPANDIVELYPRPSYTAPVTGCVGANAFVLDAFGIPGGTIQTPYSLYQFFEIFGVARQRSASEVGEALLSAIPDGAVVFFLDPSMSLPWKRPKTDAERSIIVSRKAYGDAGIWNAKSQKLINLTDGKIVSEADLLTLYSRFGDGADFTSKFVYGWVTAADFISTYSVAAAEAFQASDWGEVNFGVLPNTTAPGRYYSANLFRNTPAVPEAPVRLSGDFISNVQQCLDCYEASANPVSPNVLPQFSFVPGQQAFFLNIGAWQTPLQGQLQFVPGIAGSELASFIEEKHTVEDFLYASFQGADDFLGGVYEGVVLGTVEFAVDVSLINSLVSPQLFVYYSVYAYKHGFLKSTTTYREFLAGYLQWSYNNVRPLLDGISWARDSGRLYFDYNTESLAFKIGSYADLIFGVFEIVKVGTKYFMVKATGEIVQVSEKFAKRATSIIIEDVSDKEFRILVDAGLGQDLFGLGNATRAEANRLGKLWVGDGYRKASNGNILISKDGLRQYRPPTVKNSPLAPTGVQANFERRSIPSGEFIHNGHLDITN